MVAKDYVGLRDVGCGCWTDLVWCGKEKDLLIKRVDSGHCG